MRKNEQNPGDISPFNYIVIHGNYWYSIILCARYSIKMTMIVMMIMMMMMTMMMMMATTMILVMMMMMIINNGIFLH